jgi:hypothetical protein
MTTAAPDFATRPRLAHRGDDVVGEEERVEPAHQIEGVVGVRERFHVADDQLRLGHALAGDVDQRTRGVEPECTRAPLCDQTQERAYAAADVEHELAGSEVDTA